MKEDDGKPEKKQELPQWWYLPAVVLLVGLMGFVVLWLMPAMN